MVKLGGRKFVGFIIILAAGGLTKYFSKDGLSHEDVLFLIAAYGAFAFGNVVNTIAAIRGGGQSGAPAPAVAPDLSALETRLDVITQGVDVQNQALRAVLMRLAGAPASPRAVEEVDTAADPDARARATANRAAIAKYVQ